MAQIFLILVFPLLRAVGSFLQFRELALVPVRTQNLVPAVGEPSSGSSLPGNWNFIL